MLNKFIVCIVLIKIFKLFSVHFINHFVMQPNKDFVFLMQRKSLGSKTTL